MSALAVEAITSRHGLLTAVHGVSLTIEPGEVLAVVGANGAGKTTLFRTIAGLHRPAEGAVFLGGIDITDVPAYGRPHLGLSMVPEGRRLFTNMTVRENIQIACEQTGRSRKTFGAVLDALPVVRTLLGKPAGGLSGGQRQAVAIARALVTAPRVLLLDEVSLGLSPAAIDTVYETLAALKLGGEAAMVVVEQDLDRAMGFCDRLVCMLEGKIVLEGKPKDLTREEVSQAYFGLHKGSNAHA
ncbi:ABC transporter ATP-binding protein [Pelagibacterium limicola]|uniref:ABC transporter ATP-binding protein n=1 Tax=Pelagibacterium limicola TaxID=2791022 RepID=UPI0018AFCDE9|nr:ABC transporter ATP-binding protein [Pelagibacterium limicola]